MPRISEVEITAFAHCPNPRCEGYTQREVPAISRTVEHTYVEKGGDMPGVETSQVYIHPCDEELCPSCGKTCEITDQRRVRYDNLSGHDPNGLLAYTPPVAA